jgi:ATP-dependent Clp protease ATP-binding subunit ClpB
VEVFEFLKDSLRPEFLNRIDDKIMFHPLTKEEIKKIAGLLLRKVHKNLAKQELKMEVSESALNLVADLGYDPQFGARPLKRVIEKELVNELAKQVLLGEFVGGETIYIGTDAKGFTFTETKGEDAEPKAKRKKKQDDKRKKMVDDVLKASKDLDDAVKDVKKDQKKDSGSDDGPKTEKE